MFRKRLTIGCPHCGGFWEGIDALTYARLMAFHRGLVTFGFDADYQRQVDDVIAQALEVLT